MKHLLIAILLLCCLPAFSEDGYRLWLRYDKVQDTKVLKAYKSKIKNVYVPGTSPTAEVLKKELALALKGLLDKDIPFTDNISSGTLVIQVNPLISSPESYEISSNKNSINITGADWPGAMYGMFHFLRLLQTNSGITDLSVTSRPKIKARILNHWDNLDRTIERGYAGFSIWDWHRLPEYIDPRYTDYARANASIGINGTVLTNVNANALMITPMYLEKVKVLADLFRPYNLKVYLTARFSAPIEIGGLKTADPLDPEVRQWWKTKVDEIYKYVPDFGGFVVKANSEGQPGPQNYNRTHADGANMLAEAVAPHNGIVMWRAFVYDSNVPDDRAKQAYSEFKSLDGKFNSNVVIQVKNGPIDFQPREPFHPLFGATSSTPLMMEFQITQEYLGQATHLAFLPVMWKECLQADTYAKGKGSTVAKVIDGTLDNRQFSAIAGVANIGNDRNWTGHLFAQSNWYGYGRLAWDHELSSLDIANEWARMTFTNDNDVVEDISWMMITSHETLVKYMTPLGLHHIMGANHHFGPGPWVAKMSRSDWTSTYYHKADSLGIGFDRTASGSKAIEQYFPDAQKQFNDEKFLLWFNHVSWDYKMKSGQTLWEEICTHYATGVEELKGIQKTWSALSSRIDSDRFRHVTMLLERQRNEAELWRNSCILYFQTFSKRPVPKDIDTGNKPLEYYINIQYPYAPGIRPRW